MNRLRASLVRVVASGALVSAAWHVGAAPAAPIYSCIDASGKRITSDRPIIECQERPQRLLNADGSVKTIVPPTPTPDERAEAEARERQFQTERTMRQDAVRRDRNLLNRFPNEAAHRKSREAALDDNRASLRRSEVRIELLNKARKPLMDEAEFYVGKPLPPFLKQQLDANDAAVKAQQDLMLNQQTEIVRINALYDVELERLKSLWGGATPGSMGVLPVTSAASAPPQRRAPVSRASASEPR
jgi:Domain of unknown function (DUF4124)